MRILLTSVFSFVFFFSILGQDSLIIDEILVTASVIPMESKKTGRSVTILSQEDIQNLPVNTIDEALRYISGVNVNSRNGFGVQADIGMRGSTFSQVLVLVDNVRFNDPLTAHFNHSIPVGLAEIDHIEIVKGPTGTAFGSDAVGGMIHIKTKTYVNKRRKDGLALMGNLAVGEHALQMVDAGAVLNANKWQFSASMKSNISDGETHVNPNFLAGVAPDSLYNNFFDIRTYSTSASYRFSEHFRANARIGYDTRDFAAKYYYTRSAFDESVEETTNAWSQLALQYQRGKHSAEFNAGYRIVDDYFAFNPLFSANEHQTTQLFLKLGHQWSISDNTQIAYGAQYLGKAIESTDRGDHENKGLGIYAEASQRLFEDMRVNGGLRMEYDENFGVELLPQVSVSYQMNNLILRTSYGRSIRAADFTERYISYQIPSLSPGRNVGNPDLLAEKSNTVDLGADWFFEKRSALSATVFYRKSKDLIDYSLRNSNEITNLSNLQADETYFYADNIADSEVLGLELSANKYFKLTDKSGVDVQLGYTYLNTEAATGELSKYISNHPKHNTFAQLSIRLDRFTLVSSSNWITRQEEMVEGIDGAILENYFTTDMKLSASLYESLSVFGQVRNLSDSQYQEILGAKMPGRWFVLGVNWNFNRSL